MSASISTTQTDLKTTFEEFRQNPEYRLRVDIRRARAAQLRDLLAPSNALDVDTFNREVWAIESRTMLSGRALRITAAGTLAQTKAELRELTDALRSGALELQGNYTWGSGSHVYAPRLQDDDLKLQYIQQAQQLLGDPALSPQQKYEKLDEIPGFGPNIASGLVMIFHPDTFAIYNRQSQNALTKLGYSASSLEVFQRSVRQVRDEVQADDFIELDLFLYEINQGNIVPPIRANVWLFQANPKYFDLTDRLLKAHVGDEDSWTVTSYREEMRPGDTVLLWLAGAQAGIYAVGELTGQPLLRTYEEDIPAWLDSEDGEPTSAWSVPFRYTQILQTPVLKATLTGHPVLRDMLILKTPNRANFRISRIEWKALGPLINLPTVGVPDYTLAQCAAETGVDETTLESWVRAIERKGQAILYGPPGTGKTYTAERLARYLVGNRDGFVETVQFHPAYAYEDFIQGIRPQSEQGQLMYPMVPGRFLDFCERAEKRQGICVLIIDEINRANLSRVFGELMYLLEYRDKQMPLAGGGTLRIPSRVRIIGTMNTADRSIALVDHALRRRFAFLPLSPNYTVLENFHAKAGKSITGLVEVLKRLNHEIDNPHYEVGISFFMRADLDQQIADIWQMEIEPYLEEYFFDRPNKVASFRWEVIQTKVRQ